MSIFFHDSCSIRCGLIFIFLDESLTNFPLYTKYSITLLKKPIYLPILQDLVNLDSWSYSDLIERNNVFPNLRTFHVKFRFAVGLIDFEFAALIAKTEKKIENNNNLILKRDFSCKSGLPSHF